MKPLLPTTWPTTPASDGEYYHSTTDPSISNYTQDIRFNPDIHIEYTIIHWLRVALFFVALMGNILICLVFSMKHYRGSLHAMLYRVLAVTDTLVVLINDGLALLPVDIIGQSLFVYNHTTCKIMGVLHFWLRALSIWFLVPIALERFIAVWFPFRTVLFNTKRRYGWIILGMTLNIFALYAPLCETLGHMYEVTGGQQIGYCNIFGHVSEHLMWYTAIFDYMNLIVSSLLPFLCIAALNTAIICGLLKSRTHLPKAFHKAHSEMRSCVIILLLISVSTIVLSLPYPIYFMAMICGCKLTTSQEKMFAFIVPVCDSISHSINIVLYCFSGRQFRQNLRKLLCCSPKNTPDCN